MREFFLNPNPQPGDRPSASDQRKLIRAAGDFTAEQAYRHPKRYARIKLLRLLEVIGPDQEESSDFHKKSGAVQWYSNNSNSVNDISPQMIQRNIVDAYGLIYDQDDLVMCLYMNRVHVPINARTVRHAITVADDDGYYPSQSEEPDTYPIKFVKLTYPEVAGQNGLTITYLDSGAAVPLVDAQDDFAHNIANQWGGLLEETPYVPKGCLIEVYHVTGQWFTFFCCTPEEESSSSSSSSLSSSGSSLSSESSGSSDSVSESSISSISESSQSESSSSQSIGGCCAEGDCLYVWTGSEWTLDDPNAADTCTQLDCDGDQIGGDCQCSPPAGSGDFVGETREGTCSPAS